MNYLNYIKLEFPSNSSNEALARSVAGAFAAQMDPTLEELGDIKTAVSEAVTNAIVHAYPDSIGKILLRCRFWRAADWKSWSATGAGALRTWQRPERRSLPPAARSGAAWALPLWRALWTS